MITVQHMIDTNKYEYNIINYVCMYIVYTALIRGEGEKYNHVSDSVENYLLGATWKKG